MISLLVGAIGIANVMLASVAERRSEIGIRRALGATRRHILLQFLSETLLLTFFGTLIGILFGIAFGKVICYCAGWNMIITSWSLFLSLCMSLIVGFCAGIHPAYQAAHIQPITLIKMI
jgi:putative ABC transport system permease protein